MPEPAPPVAGDPAQMVGLQPIDNGPFGPASVAENQVG